MNGSTYRRTNTANPEVQKQYLLRKYTFADGGGDGSPVRRGRYMIAVSDFVLRIGK